MGYNCGIMWKGLALTLVLLGLAVLSASHQQHPNHKQKGPSQAPAVASLSGDQPKAQEETAQSQEKMQWFYVLISWPEGITAVALIVTLGAIVWQSSETRRAAEAALSQGRAQMDADRGWVLIEGIGNPRVPLFVSGSPYVPGIVYRVKVFGNTPVRIGRERYRCRIVPAIPGSKPPQPQLEKIPQYTAEFDRFSGSISPPGYSYAMSVGLESGILTEDSFTALKNRETFLCCYCSIQYADIFGREAITQSCQIYDFELGGVFQSPDGTKLNQEGFREGGPPEYRHTT